MEAALGAGDSAFRVLAFAPSRGYFVKAGSGRTRPEVLRDAETKISANASQADPPELLLRAGLFVFGSTG